MDCVSWPVNFDLQTWIDTYLRYECSSQCLSCDLLITCHRAKCKITTLLPLLRFSSTKPTVERKMFLPKLHFPGSTLCFYWDEETHTFKSAPTAAAKSVLLMTSRSLWVMPGPPFLGILSPPVQTHETRVCQSCSYQNCFSDNFFCV